MDVTRSPRPIPGRSGPRVRRRIWWVSFVLFTALGGLWALTNPLLAVSDEGAHVFKAITVAERPAPAAPTTSPTAPIRT